MNNFSNIFKLSIINLEKKPLRTTMLIILTTILSFVLFGGTIFSLNLQNGLDCANDRLGADIMIVPEGNASDMSEILTSGKPSNFYLNKDIYDNLNKINGIDKSTYQVFLQTLKIGCCSLPAQIIAFDEENDFLIKPWIERTYDKKIDSNSVITGHDVVISGVDNIKLFNTKYNIVSKLEKTGTGLDLSVYTSLENAKILYEKSLIQGAKYPENFDFDNSISSILIKVKDGYDINSIVKEIYMEFDDIEVITPQTSLRSVQKSLNGIKVLINLFIALFLISSLLTLYIVFSISANERKKEFAIYRVLGITKKNVIKILLIESLSISVLGCVIGIIISSIIIFPFNSLITMNLGFPYLQLNIYSIITVLLIDLFISLFIGSISSISAINKISKAETYITMRDN